MDEERFEPTTADMEAFMRELDEMADDDLCEPGCPRPSVEEPGRNPLSEEARAAKHQILQCLADLGVATCEVEYHGECSEVSFRHCIALTEDGEHVPVPDDLKRMAERFVDSALPAYWDADYGGYGTAVFDVHSATVQFDHRVVEIVDEIGEV